MYLNRKHQNINSSSESLSVFIGVGGGGCKYGNIFSVSPPPPEFRQVVCFSIKYSILTLNGDSAMFFRMTSLAIG